MQNVPICLLFSSSQANNLTTQGDYFWSGQFQTYPAFLPNLISLDWMLLLQYIFSYVNTFRNSFCPHALVFI